MYCPWVGKWVCTQGEQGGGALAVNSSHTGQTHLAVAQVNLLLQSGTRAAMMAAATSAPSSAACTGDTPSRRCSAVARQPVEGGGGEGGKGGRGGREGGRGGKEGREGGTARG
jgi:hypothetical protein